MKKSNNNLAKSVLTFKNMTENLLPIESSQFLLYTAEDGKVHIEVFIQDETVWLTQKKND